MFVLPHANMFREMNIFNDDMNNGCNKIRYSELNVDALSANE